MQKTACNGGLFLKDIASLHSLMCHILPLLLKVLHSPYGYIVIIADADSLVNTVLSRFSRACRNKNYCVNSFSGCLVICERKCSALAYK